MTEDEDRRRRQVDYDEDQKRPASKREYEIAQQAANNALALLHDQYHPLMNRDEIQRIAETAASKAANEAVDRLEKDLFTIFASIGLPLDEKSRNETATNLILVFRMRTMFSTFAKWIAGSVAGGIGITLVAFLMKPWK